MIRVCIHVLEDHDVTILMDATGISTRQYGRWRTSRLSSKKVKRRFVKVHLSLSLERNLILIGFSTKGWKGDHVRRLERFFVPDFDREMRKEDVSFLNTVRNWITKLSEETPEELRLKSDQEPTESEFFRDRPTYSHARMLFRTALSISALIPAFSTIESRHVLLIACFNLILGVLDGFDVDRKGLVFDFPLSQRL